MNMFAKLIQRSGGYSLPFLIHLYDDEKNIELRFVNSDHNITYNDQVYIASSFSYSPNPSAYGFDGGGKLEIASRESNLIDLVERFYNIHLDVIGVMDEIGTITEIETFKHHYGTVTGDRKTLSFNFDKDDRLDMTFPTLIWSTQNNRGNS